VGTAKSAQYAADNGDSDVQRTSRLAAHVCGQPYQAVGQNVRSFKSAGYAHFAGCDGRSTLKTEPISENSKTNPVVVDCLV
jgi:hypothetical protein